MKDNKPFRSPWFLFAKITFVIGAGMLIPGFFLKIFVLLIQGAVWLAVGVFFWLVYREGYDRLKRLKIEGICYEAEIIQIVPNAMMNYLMRIGCVSAHAECSYINQEDKTCLVKSNLFITYSWWTAFQNGAVNYSKESFCAKVYVSPANPRDYHVDIRDKQQIDLQADYDYR